MRLMTEEEYKDYKSLKKKRMKLNKKVKIKVGDFIVYDNQLGRISNFLRSGSQIQINWQLFVDIYNTKVIYDLIRNGSGKLYKEVSIGEIE
jgi:hypothetical protein